MAYFYRDGRLKIGTAESFTDVVELTRSANPAYVYDLDDITLRYRSLAQAFGELPHAIHYAMKANSNRIVLRHLASLGSGVDTVSGGEIRLALDAGFKPEKIVFSGVAKTVAEIEFAIGLGIKQINVESPQELERIRQVSERMGRSVDVAFRMNPDVNPQTHPYITTGFRENKFGMDASFIPELVSILRESEGRLRLRGLTMHIGSQLFELDVIREAIEKIKVVHQELKTQGFALDRMDIGGGLGIRYETDSTESEFEVMKIYGQIVKECLGNLGVEVLCEPGRILVARSGLLIGEVQYIKRTSANDIDGKQFAILNTGMHHLLRPALYSARHRVLPLVKSAKPEARYDIVGPICESSDFLAKEISLPALQPGDLIGIADSGAYGFSMASRYNAQELPMEISVAKGQVVQV